MVTTKTQGRFTQPNVYEWKQRSFFEKALDYGSRGLTVLGGAALLGLMSYQIFRTTPTSQPIEHTNIAIESSNYHIQDTQAELERIAQEEFMVLKGGESMQEKYEAYKHNKQILIDISKVWAQEFGSIQGNYTDSNQNLEESLIQQYQESKLQHINPNGTIKKSFADAHGSSQFTDIAVKDFHQKRKEFIECNSEYACIPEFSKEEMYEPSVKGAIANIGANIAYKKMLLERYALQDLDEHQALRRANSRYHDGEGIAKRKIAKANARGTTEFQNYLGPEGKKYINGTDSYREIYENPEQFDMFADMQKAYAMMSGKLDYATKLESDEAKKRQYEQVSAFSNYLQAQGENFGLAHGLKAQYELARLEAKSNPNRALSLAEHVFANAELTNNPKFFKENSQYLINLLN